MLRVTIGGPTVDDHRGKAAVPARRWADRRLQKMPVHIKLRSSKGERFERIKRQLSEEMGYQPSNPEILGIVMAYYNFDESNVESLAPLGRSD